MKKVISLLLSLAVLLAITSGLNLTAFADTITGECGDNVTYSLDPETGELTVRGTSEMYYYLSYNSPFHNNEMIKSVIIEDGVTNIGSCAFNECKNLTSVVIP